MNTYSVAEAPKAQQQETEAELSPTVEEKWGFPLVQLYQLAVKFYKEKEGKALVLSYAARLEFVCLTQQAAHGPCRIDTLPPLGVLDIVGRDRREAWQRLGDMSRSDAMLRYIEMLDASCPIFRPFAEAHKRNLEAEERRREEERAAEEERRRAEETERRKKEREWSRQAETKRYIQDALNRQTYPQFRVYAAQQYPGNPDQQAVLIRKLQQQHYQQYIQQLYQYLQREQQQQRQLATDPVQGEDGSTPDRLAEDDADLQHLSMLDVADKTDSSEETKDGSPCRLAPATMWTRDDLSQFKARVQAERASGAVITVGQGEVLTVRVPARSDGTCLFWEFASDQHDLGFGVSFEWGPTAQYEVTVEAHLGGDSGEEEEENAEVVVEGAASGHPRPTTSCVVPVYRRDCHHHVYAGSHRFPAHEGVYLLKFDNSYNLWRAKTLYYRVFYTR